MSQFLTPQDRASRQVKLWKAEGAKVVFTNGCFDILHPGHIHCLQRAKAMGDYLVIGLNSDDSCLLYTSDAADDQ